MVHGIVYILYAPCPHFYPSMHVWGCIWEKTGKHIPSSILYIMHIQMLCIACALYHGGVPVKILRDLGALGGFSSQCVGGMTRGVELYPRTGGRDFGSRGGLSCRTCEELRLVLAIPTCGGRVSAAQERWWIDRLFSNACF